MDVFSYTNEYISTFPRTRLFKALVLDFNNLIPKLIPQAIKSINIIQGDGGAETIKQINIMRGNQLIGVNNRIDELNEETSAYRYSLIDQKEQFESIVHEVKLEPTPEGGSKNKLTSKYYTKGDVELKEEDVKVDKERFLEIYKVGEAYPLQTPDAYA